MESLVSFLSCLTAITNSAARSIMSNPESQTLYIDPDHFPYIEQDTSVRTDLGTINCLVRGYPSSGGIVSGTFTAAELDWLGLSRLKPP
jgi:hypothetical protein